ncbi:MAG: RsiV family protein [Treponema sp.]|nr:RsiV family protein [Treponema sp.]
MISCAAAEGSSPFTGYSYNESVKAFEKAEPEENREANLFFNLFDVSRSGPLRDLVRQLLYNGQSAEEYARQKSRAWKKDYRESAANNPGYVMDWNYDEEHSLASAGTFAVITVSISEFTGGAHPNWFQTSHVLDLETPRRLGLDDIISQAGFPNLYTFIDRELRLLSEEKSGEVLPPRAPLSDGIFFEDSILPGDFYPSGEGLCFQWDPYEIAPYTYGGIEITLGWQELGLSPEGESLSAAFGD